MSREIILTCFIVFSFGFFSVRHIQLFFKAYPHCARALDTFFVDKLCARYFPKINQRIYQRRKEKMDKIRSDFCKQAGISHDEYEREAVKILKLYVAFETRFNAFYERGKKHEK